MKEGWQLKELGDISSIMYGHTAKSSNEIRGPRYLRITDIQNDSVDWELVPNCPDLAEEFEKYKLKPEDIVFARTGATTGKSFLIKDPPQAVFASYLIRVQTNYKEIIPKYLSLFFRSPSYWKHIITGTTGSAQGGFNASKLSKLSIPIPPLSEQQQIVAVLDQAFTAIDQARANVERNLENVRELFQSKLNEVFSQKGEGWEENRLGEIAYVKSGGTPLRHKKDYWEGDIAWYSSGELNNIYTIGPERHINNLAIENSNAKLFPKRSLLIGMYDTAALKMSILDRDAAFNQAISGVKPNPKIDLRFIMHSINFQKSDILNLRRGVRQKNLNLKMMKDIKIFLPVLSQQQAVVEEIDTVQVKVKKLEGTYRDKIYTLEELKKSILQKAFTGELTAQPIPA